MTTPSNSVMWSQIWDVALDSPYVYCAFSDGLDILEMQADDSLKEIARVPIDSCMLTHVRVADGIAWVGIRTSNSSVFQPVLVGVDVTNPADPKVVEKWSAPGWTTDLEICGPRAYVLLGNRFQVLDLTTPNHLTLLGEWNDSVFQTSPFGLGVRSDTVVVAAGNLFFFDATNPAVIEYLGTFNTPQVAMDAIMSDSLAYVKDGPYYIPGGLSGISIVSIANPRSPTLLGSRNFFSDLTGLCVNGQSAYLLQASNGVNVLDISSPPSPTRIGCYATPGRAIAGAAHGSTLVVAQSTYIDPDGWGSSACAVDTTVPVAERPDSGDLIVLDVSSPDQPTLRSRYDLPRNANTVTCADGLAYVGDWEGGMTVVDTRNPEGMVELGWLPTNGGVGKVVVHGNYVFAPVYGQGISVADRADPLHLQWSYQISSLGNVRAIAFRGDTMFVAAESAGLLAIDISNLASPQFLGSFSDLRGDGSAYDVALDDSIAAVACGNEGLFLINVSDPSQMSFVAQYPPSFDPYQFTTCVQVHQHVAYFNMLGEVHAVEISDPANPVWLSSASHGAPVANLCVLNADLLGVARIIGGVDIIDIRDPNHLSVTAQLNGWGATTGLAADSAYLYMANYYSLKRQLLPVLTSVQNDETEPLPASVTLSPAYPNPFNPSTTVSYSLPQNADVEISITNLLGQIVSHCTTRESAGQHSFTWNAANNATGIYTFTVRALGQTKSAKLLLLK